MKHKEDKAGNHDADFLLCLQSVLSGEKLISLAEKEQKERLQKVRSLVSGMADVLAVLLVVLPLYPFRVEERVYSVPLSAYQGITLRHRQIYWCLFLLLTAVGIVRIFLTLGEHFREEKRVMRFSMILGTVSVLLLTASGETYAAALAFLLLLGKGAALFFTSDETAQKTHESDIKDRKQ